MVRVILLPGAYPKCFKAGQQKKGRGMQLCTRTRHGCSIVFSFREVLIEWVGDGFWYGERKGLLYEMGLVEN